MTKLPVNPPPSTRVARTVAWCILGLSLLVAWQLNLIPPRWEYAMIMPWLIGIVISVPIAIWIVPLCTRGAAVHIARGLVITVGVTPTIIGAEGGLMPIWLLIAMGLGFGDGEPNLIFVMLFAIVPAVPVFLVAALMSAGTTRDRHAPRTNSSVPPT